MKFYNSAGIGSLRVSNLSNINDRYDKIMGLPRYTSTKSTRSKITWEQYCRYLLQWLLQSELNIWFSICFHRNFCHLSNWHKIIIFVWNISIYSSHVWSNYICSVFLHVNYFFFFAAINGEIPLYRIEMCQLWWIQYNQEHQNTKL